MPNYRNLTIQDYFNQANTVARTRNLRCQARSTVQSGQAGFSDTLDAAQASMTKRFQGRSITEYFKNPVRVQSAGRASQATQVTPAAQSPSNAIDGSAAVSESTAQAPQAVGTISVIKGDSDQIQASVDSAAAKYELEPGLIHAVIKAESDYEINAVSSAGAQGLMQLMPATAEELGVSNPFDIDQNIDGGARYLRSMLTRYDGDLDLALSAYNAGPGNVDKYNGQVPFAETRDYVDRVLRYARQFSDDSVASS